MAASQAKLNFWPPILIRYQRIPESGEAPSDPGPTITRQEQGGRTERQLLGGRGRARSFATVVKSEFSNPPRVLTFISFLMSATSSTAAAMPSAGKHSDVQSVRTLTYCTGGYHNTSNGLMVCPLPARKTFLM
jgi:hypothetical protein